MDAAQPTDQDRENARIRQEIAERQAREYAQVQAWAAAVFGPGWVPSHRHFLIDKADEARCRRTGERPTPAATVFTVKTAAGDRRHFTLNEGKPVECASYEAGFGPLLLEPHPTQRIEVRGQIVAPHRYSLCWAPFELYTPRSAEALAAARERRQERAVEREAAASPLFADLIREEGYVPPPRKGNAR